MRAIWSSLTVARRPTSESVQPRRGQRRTPLRGWPRPHHDRDHHVFTEHRPRSHRHTALIGTVGMVLSRASRSLAPVSSPRCSGGQAPAPTRLCARALGARRGRRVVGVVESQLPPSRSSTEASNSPAGCWPLCLRQRSRWLAYGHLKLKASLVKHPVRAVLRHGRAGLARGLVAIRHRLGGRPRPRRDALGSFSDRRIPHRRSLRAPVVIRLKPQPGSIPR